MNAQFAQAYLGIGEVLLELRGEFPDISVSKIRFLESEGLISPARSPSGYRRFGPADVEKLRFILTAQRDQYLPLRVIKERLEHAERARQEPPGRAASTAGGSGPSASGAIGARGVPGVQSPRDGTVPPRGSTDRTEMVTRRDLIDATGIDDDQLTELEAHGLVRRVGRLYRQDALDVAAAAGALAPYGVQARHLRASVTAAEREVALIEQLVAPIMRQRSPRSVESAGQTARNIAPLLLRLHRAMLESALADAGLPAVDLPDDVALPAATVTADQSGHDGRRHGSASA